MLSNLATSLILGVTLFLFLLTVLIPVKFDISKLLLTPDDNFISSRNTQSWISVGLSLYAGAVGTWALTAPIEAAVITGWWGVLGYAFGCGLPWTFYFWSGIRLRHLMPSRGFTSLEFVNERFGRVMHIVVALVSLLYLFGMLVAELVAIGTSLALMSPGFSPLAATISVAVVTNIYSSLGGFPAAIFSDKLQGIITIILMIICYVGIFGMGLGEIDFEYWEQANSFSSDGLVLGFVLVVSCFIVEQINQTTWQRVFAARTDSELYWGFGLGIFLMLPSMILLGFIGILGNAASHSGYITLDPEMSGQALFLMLAKLPPIWLGLATFLVIGLVTSTVDTIQTGMAAMIAGELSNRKLSLNWARLFSLVLNVPAVLIASLAPVSILNVLMTSNVLAVAIVPSLLLGFTDLATPISALCGVTSALGSILILGWIFTKSFTAGFMWGIFPHGYNGECLATFCVVPLVGTVVTIMVARIEFYFDSNKRREQQECLVKIHNSKKVGTITTCCSVETSMSKSTAEPP